MARVDGDEALLSELIQIFLEELPEHLNGLEHGFAAADFGVIQRLAHTLKGELIYLGLTGEAEKAKTLEDQGRERNLQAARELFPEFKAELLLIAAAMRKPPSHPVSAKTTHA